MAIIWTDELLKLFEFQKNYCIQAGAGSGKTTTLVELYLRILLNSRNTDNPLLPENILALTFTDKAATELRERIYSRIQEELKISENNQDTAAYDYLKKISDNLRFAKIGTFHSFCMQLLKQYSIDYGISPDFEIIDNIEDLKITELFFEETLKKNFADDIEYAAVLLREFRIINNFSDKLLKIYENIRNKGVHIETLYENSKNLINEKMPEQSEIICQINECLNKIKNISSPAETIKKFIDNLKTLNLQITEQITNLELFKLSEIIKGNWGNNKYLKDELKDAVDELIKIRFFPILNKITYLIVKIIFEAHKKIIEYKINNSTINFNDLLEF
ncbi:MAG TPA: UvrD-helicase domain-containing protein, partial [bacterium]|nr:UvrD-helicase domain-containing protein [bacterium]